MGGGDHPESRRGEGCRTEERHRDCILDRRRPGQRRHRERGRAESDRCRHQPARNRSGAEQRLGHRGQNEEGDEQADAAIGHQGAGENDGQYGAACAEALGHPAGDRRDRSAVLHQLAEQRAQQERGKYCATNWAPLPMKVCVRLGEQRLTGEAAASRAADGASSSTLQPP